RMQSRGLILGLKSYLIQGVAELQLWSLSNNHRSLNHVPQLADITGPIVIFECVDDALWNGFDPLAEFKAQLIYQMWHQRTEIFAMLPKRSHHDRENA